MIPELPIQLLEHSLPHRLSLPPADSFWQGYRLLTEPVNSKIVAVQLNDPETVTHIRINFLRSPQLPYMLSIMRCKGRRLVHAKGAGMVSRKVSCQQAVFFGFSPSVEELHHEGEGLFMRVLESWSDFLFLGGVKSLQVELLKPMKT